MWQFWIDRGGTFTDIVARRPTARSITHKLLSENPGALRRRRARRHPRPARSRAGDAPIPAARIDAVKMGTTVATNALLERKGEPHRAGDHARAFATRCASAIRTGRRLFARRIVLPELLYARVIEVDERVTAEGEVLDAARRRPRRGPICSAAYRRGIARRRHRVDARLPLSRRTRARSAEIARGDRLHAGLGAATRYRR